MQVHKSVDNGTPGYEIYVLATGMTKDDVKCAPHTPVFRAFAPACMQSLAGTACRAA